MDQSLPVTETTAQPPSCDAASWADHPVARQMAAAHARAAAGDVPFELFAATGRL